MTTAAESFGERLVAVILTGSGSDGAAGAHSVKEAGGTIVIRDPATAAFPSIPRALLAPLVDATLPLEKIGEFVAELLVDGRAPAESPASSDLTTLLGHLRERRGIDFSAYKRPTIQRRLRRRMAAVGVSTIADYLAYLDRDREEEQRLIGHFLIKVTRLFRNPTLFEHLRATVLPELIDAARSQNRGLRLWSAGCATGEEAYSLALLVADLHRQEHDPPGARIFATDLDDTALAFARRGLYPASALTELPAELIDRYFTEDDGSYAVGKQVRSLIVFGNHDLGQRPPFPHTDLILCGNVLIYFTPELQKRALDIFAYSLRDGGIWCSAAPNHPAPPTACL